MASTHIGWPQYLILAAFSFTTIGHAQGLTQQYCASVNTGSDFGESMEFELGSKYGGMLIRKTQSTVHGHH